MHFSRIVMHAQSAIHLIQEKVTQQTKKLSYSSDTRFNTDTNVHIEDVFGNGHWLAWILGTTWILRSIHNKN